MFQSKLNNKNSFKDVKPGWTVKVFQKIKEGEKSRIQAFEGTVIARKHGSEPGGTITIRRASGGYGVEKTYPIYLPTIDKVQIIKKSKTKKSKLYYLREKTAREVRRKMKVRQVSSENKEVTT